METKHGFTAAANEQELIAHFIRKTILTDQSMYISMLRPFMAAGNDMFNFLQQPYDTDSAYRFATFINNVPDTTGDWHITGKIMWNTYKKWLDDFVPAITELSPEEAKMLNDSRKFCEDHYDMYAKYREKYDNIHVEFLYLQLMPENERPPDYKVRLEITAKKRENALLDWEVEGNRTQFDYNYQILSDLGRRAMGYSKGTLDDYFGSPQISALGNYYSTTVSPPAFMSPDHRWEKFTIFRRESGPFLEAHADEIHKRWGLEVKDAVISFEMIRTAVMRDWFVPDALGMRSWKWASSTAGNPGGDFPLSDGNMPPKGHLVMYATEIVFVRNITVELNPKAGNNAAVLAKLSAEWEGRKMKKDSFFFDHRGSAQEQDKGGPQNDESTGGGWTVSGNSISDPTPFMSAVMCRLLPKSPNPDWTLHWPVTEQAVKPKTKEIQVFY